MYRILNILIVLCLLVPSISGQVLRDSKGKDFWLAIPPNDHVSGLTNDPAIVAVFVATTQACQVSVDARRRDGTVDKYTVQVPANVVWEFRFSADLYELRGATQIGAFGQDDERPNPASIHVMAGEDVTVYAVMRDDNTSDAWLVLPTDALSTDYIISTYESDANVATAYPSQFVLVATEDSTNVVIDLSVDRSCRTNGSRRTVTLNKGESYLLQARVSNGRIHDDLTGSRITSSKPLVAIASHRRAQVPVLGSTSSRDCLVEQMPGTDTWGKRILVPPLSPASSDPPFSVDDVPVCRILAQRDSTIVSVNGSAPWRIDATKFWDVPLDRALNIDATQPVLVTIIDRSANRTANGISSKPGDPSLIVVPPFEQFLDEYRVVTIEPRIGGNAFYTAHYITCLAPTSSIASLRVNGNPPSQVFPIPGSTFSYTTYSVNVGTHLATCDEPFGIIVYGYGPAESYGYTGGMAFQRLFEPSLRLRTLDARGLAGAIDTVAVIVDSIDNVENLRLSGIREVVCSVSFDGTIYVPTNQDSLSISSTTVTAHMRYAFDTLHVGDTIGLIRGVHTLGMVSLCSATIDTAIWKSPNGFPVPVKTTMVSGEIETLGICEENLNKRLFDPTAKPRSRVMFYDVLGRSLGPTPENLPPGVYFER
jgi:IgGFc binding protein